MSIDTLAESKGLTMVELLDEIERIVNSGTKINIDYYIKEVMEEDVVEEIYDYFRTSESESVQDAIDELTQDDYSEEEIRLVRIKFLSELGH